MPNKGELLNKKEKQAYRKTLLEKKDRLIHKLSEVYTESKEIESDVAQDVVDKAESSYTKEFLLSLSDAERRQLMLIDQALKRIDSSDFGLCLSCRKPIGKKRLDVVPWAPYCIECQERKENEREAEKEGL
jgi:DnaK suppressor protein